MACITPAWSSHELSLNGLDAVNEPTTSIGSWETNVVKLDLFSATSKEDSGYMIDKASFEFLPKC